MASSLSCPAARLAFLKASHFSLGPEPRLHASSQLSTTHRDFRAPPPAPPPARSPAPPRPELFHVDVHAATQGRVSEAHRAFPPPPPVSQEKRRARPRDVRAAAAPLPGLRAAPAVSTARASFRWPPQPPRVREQIRGARLIFDRDSVPPGDPAKLGLPLTTYRELFPPHWAAALQPLAPSRHLGGPNPLQWDHKTQDPETTYLRQFQALPGSPALMCEKASSSVVLGDHKLGYRSMCSEQKQMHHPQGLPPERYDKALASALTHHANIPQGDGCFRDKTTKAQHFCAHEPQALGLQHNLIPTSHILQGARNPGPNCLTTSHNFFYRQPPPTRPSCRHPPPDLLESHVIFGEPTLLSRFFQTTMGTDYSPPGQQEPCKAPTLHLQESDLPQGTGKTYFLTTNQKMLVPHDTAPASITHRQLQRCKYSHVEPPLGTKRFFSTQYKEEFPFKSLGPPDLKAGSFHESHVPLGSPPPKGCGTELRGPQARQLPLYPCRSQQ
ncbi:stabilizer of axonemal microtubules 5 [Erinaceus europaeus]|uniref:Stabilizer of axonemal microtubules 5 n=1 Tax=Erinaceus europaeus TaxID=9365 RepID=A0ABM3WLF4_ERIEU|nr:stabilizer of axonemal microtubules 5 [Erinaceus europaeus]